MQSCSVIRNNPGRDGDVSQYPTKKSLPLRNYAYRFSDGDRVAHRLKIHESAIDPPDDDLRTERTFPQVIRLRVSLSRSYVRSVQQNEGRSPRKSLQTRLVTLTRGCYNVWIGELAIVSRKGSPEIPRKCDPIEEILSSLIHLIQKQRQREAGLLSLRRIWQSEPVSECHGFVLLAFAAVPSTVGTEYQRHNCFRYHSQCPVPNIREMVHENNGLELTQLHTCRISKNRRPITVDGGGSRFARFLACTEFFKQDSMQAGKKALVQNTAAALSPRPGNKERRLSSPPVALSCVNIPKWLKDGYMGQLSNSCRCAVRTPRSQSEIHDRSVESSTSLKQGTALHSEVLAMQKDHLLRLCSAANASENSKYRGSTKQIGNVQILLMFPAPARNQEQVRKVIVMPMFSSETGPVVYGRQEGYWEYGLAVAPSREHGDVRNGRRKRHCCELSKLGDAMGVDCTCGRAGVSVARIDIDMVESRGSQKPYPTKSSLALLCWLWIGFGLDLGAFKPMATIKSANNGPEKRTILIWRSWAEQGCHVCLRRLPQHVESTRSFRWGTKKKISNVGIHEFIATNAQILGCGFDARTTRPCVILRKDREREELAPQDVEVGDLTGSLGQAARAKGGGKARRGEVPESTSLVRQLRIRSGNHFLPWVEEEGRCSVPDFTPRYLKLTVRTCQALPSAGHGVVSNFTRPAHSFHAPLFLTPSSVPWYGYQWHVPVLLLLPCQSIRPFLETRESHLVLNHWKQVSVSHTHLTPASVSQLDQSALEVLSTLAQSLFLTFVPTLVVITFKIDLSSISPYHYDTLFTHQDLHLPPASLCKCTWHGTDDQLPHWLPPSFRHRQVVRTDT
ncbi:hypothetical protein CCUS01_04114 [Colletotrichum cuscutae]|uniref:Uncharacterized protein n=1 Tax=Colletotrichum cuscutae TaxID=1209917 RepID=A0AAI9VET5_9PEZI|nr:hypothetical protein CCUS01_04114 [Colletotrichum cuscutae]